MVFVLSMLLLGCPTRLEPNHGCEEVAFAIGARSEVCFEDSEIGTNHYDVIMEQYSCLLDPETGEVLGYVDEDNPYFNSAQSVEYAYACALTMRNVACEVVIDMGDDMQRRLEIDPLCSLILGAP